MATRHHLLRYSPQWVDGHGSWYITNRIAPEPENAKYLYLGQTAFTEPSPASFLCYKKLEYCWICNWDESIVVFQNIRSKNINILRRVLSPCRASEKFPWLRLRCRSLQNHWFIRINVVSSWLPHESMITLLSIGCRNLRWGEKRMWTLVVSEI